MIEALRWKAGPSVVYAGQSFPTTVRKTIFLAGPTPRDASVASWRPQMIETLTRLGFDGHIFSPEPEGGVWQNDYTGQIAWEEEGLNRADVILFWVPRDIKGGMPALTTNDEWGTWKASGKVVWGAPLDAEKVSYQVYYAKRFGAPTATTMTEAAQAAMQIIGTGAVRTGGECQIPITTWRKPEFQGWLQTQKNVGNRLDGARVVWSFRVPPPDFNTSGKPPKHTFLYALHVDVYVASEDRHKTNEIVLFRPDIASVVLYRRPPGAGLPATRVVLVKEFRSPGRNSKAFVYELPGGSSKEVEPVETTALHEVEEEIGVSFSPRRMRFVGVRQIAATLSAHLGSVFAIQLTAEELAQIEALEESGEARGVVEDTERTYPAVRTLSQIARDDMVDWAQFGMILSATGTDAL